MDEEIRQWLAQIPDKPPRSRLEPHADLIRQLRRKRLTYRQIADLLKTHAGVSVHWTTVYAFLRVRARHRCDVLRPKYEMPDERPAAAPGEGNRGDDDRGAPGPAPYRTRAEMYAYIEELKRRKATPPPPETKPRFHYEEGQPLTLITDAKELEKAKATLEALRVGPKKEQW